MQRMYEHIKAFSYVMAEKGYTGHFQSTFGFNDRLFDNLLQHVLECYKQLKDIGPFHLTTYSKWTDDEQPYIRCCFAMDFSENKGFEVLKMKIGYGDKYGIFRSKEMPILRNSDIPTCAEANRMNIERKGGLKM